MSDSISQTNEHDVEIAEIQASRDIVIKLIELKCITDCQGHCNYSEEYIGNIFKAVYQNIHNRSDKTSLNNRASV